MSRAGWLGAGVGLGVVGVGAWLARRAQAATLGADVELDVGVDPDGAGDDVPAPAPLGAAPPASIVSPPSPTGWVWPVPRFADGRAPRISDGWGSKRDGGKRRHRGVDVMYRRKDRRELVEQFPPGTPNGSPMHFMPDATPVLAARAGEVRWVKLTRRGFEVVIRHEGWATYYQHLERPLVRVGQGVVTGEAIGIVGGSPIDGGKLKHLHFELRRGGTSAGAIDPEPVMARWPVLAAPVVTARNARDPNRGDRFVDSFRIPATPDESARRNSLPAQPRKP